MYELDYFSAPQTSSAHLYGLFPGTDFGADFQEIGFPLSSRFIVGMTHVVARNC